MQTHPSRIYLASQSPRRQALLMQIGVAYDLLLPQANEDAESLEAVHADDESIAYVLRVCQAKLAAAIERRHRQQLPAQPILCADTTVALKHHILGKPENAAHAFEMLSQLSNTTHHVHTAIAIYWQNEIHTALSSSQVSFRRLGEEEIMRYIDTQEPFGKAGSYALQGRAVEFVENISGSPTGIVGLPLFETCQLLRKIKLIF